MKKALVLTVCIAISVLMACSQNGRSSAVMGEKITATNLDEISKKISEDKSIDAKDLELYLNGIARLSNVKDSLVGKTVKDVIVWQENFIKNNDLNAISNISNLGIVKMNTTNKYLGMTPYETPDGKKINVLYFILENNLNRPIKAIVGEVAFYYQDETTKRPIQLKPFPFSYNVEIKANSKDTIQLNQNHLENDQMSNLIRDKAKNISGFLNITSVDLNNQTKK